MKMKQQRDRIWRWLALIAVLLNVVFSYQSDNFMPGQAIGVVTQKYDSLFTPATYAFSIWGIIYTAFILFAIYQLLPPQRSVLLFDTLSKPFIFLNLLAMIWIAVYRMDFIFLSAVVISVMLATSIMLYLLVRNAVLRHEQSNWLSVPFSLLAAWLSVATLANICILLISQDWAGGAVIQITSTMVMILVVGLLGVFVSYRCADFIFTAVISWACIAIFIARGSEYYSIGAVALLSASFPVLWFLLAITKGIAYRHRVWANKFSFGETIRLKLNGQNKLFFGRL